jgi:hypothetical protein
MKTLTDDLSLATDSPTSMSIQLQNLSMFSDYTAMTANVHKCWITCALRSKGNALSPSNRPLLAARLQHKHFFVRVSTSPIPTISPSETCRVLGVDLNTTLTFTKHG